MRSKSIYAIVVCLLLAGCGDISIQPKDADGVELNAAYLAPPVLSVVAATTSSVTLSWTDPNTRERGFEVLRNGVVVASLAKNTTRYTNSGLTANTTYSYRVRGVGSRDPGPLSNTVTATTVAASTPTPTPTATPTPTPTATPTPRASETPTPTPVNHPPTVTISNYSGTAGVALTMAGTATDTDGDAITNYYFTYGDGAGEYKTTPSTTHTYAAAGSYAARFWAFDGTIWGSMNFNVTIAAAPTPTPTPTPTATPTATPTPTAPIVTFLPHSGLSAVPLELRGSATSPTGAAITSYFLQFGDGLSATSSDGIFRHVYVNPGTYTAVLYAYNGVWGQASATVTIAASGLPIVVANPQKRGLLSQQILFDGSGSYVSGGGTLSSWQWEFGDGATGSGSRVRHQYASVGAYSGRLTIRTSTGLENSTSFEVTVRSEDLFDARIAALTDFAAPILSCVRRYDTQSPIFHGCIDWHSAVHATYALHVLYRITRDTQYLDAAEAVLATGSLEEELAQIQAGTLNEVPYGYAWFLLLARERERTTGMTDLRPLAQEVSVQLSDWLVSIAPFSSTFLNYNAYSNLSWPVENLYAWAVSAGDSDLAAAVADFTRTHMLTPCDLGWANRPSGFFAACLMQNYAVLRVLPAAETAAWRAALPVDPWFDPVVAPETLHYAGLNFSRSWGFWALYRATGNAVWRDHFANHVQTTLDYPEYYADSDTSNGYLYSHWVAQFGVHALALTYEP